MGRIEELCERYQRHISIPWQKTIAGAQRVVMIVYDKDLERTLRARKTCFVTATEEAGHDWHEIDVSSIFSRWMAQDEYREEYFRNPNDLQIKLDAEFEGFVADEVKQSLHRDRVGTNSVLAVVGLGNFLGFARWSRIIKLIEGDIKGRLVVFFPGSVENNNYRLLDARDGWNYLAVPITLNGEGAN